MLHFISLNIAKVSVGNRYKLSKIGLSNRFAINGKEVKFVKQILDNELSLTPLYNTLEKRIIDKVYMLRKLCKYWTYKSAL